jgi:hypothetical protein
LQLRRVPAQLLLNPAEFVNLVGPAVVHGGVESVMIAALWFLLLVQMTVPNGGRSI